MEGFKEDEKGTRRVSVLSSFSLSRFSVIHDPYVAVSVHALSSSLRGADFWSCHLLYRVSSYDIGERCSVQDEENGPQY